MPHLIALIQDEDQRVQLATVEALSEVGGLLAKRALNRCLELGDESLELVAGRPRQHRARRRPLGPALRRVEVRGLTAEHAKNAEV